MASRPVPVPEPESEPAATTATATAAAAAKGPSAVAQYDYEAAEGNEISFPDGAIIEDIVSCQGCRDVHVLIYWQAFPDDDWWEGTYKGKRGLFPANYVELRE